MEREKFILSNGILHESIGYGTWQIPADESGVAIIRDAIAAGYRHIDTAARYQNEKQVGEAVRTCGIPREELTIVSKVWRSEHGYDNTMRAFEKTMAELGLDYLDMYLIHWPVPVDYKRDSHAIDLSTWRALEQLYKEGRVKVIGVANFMVRHLEPLIQKAEIVPMVDQIEIHPGCLQTEIYEYCKAHEIHLQAWRPIGLGAKGPLITNEAVQRISAEHRKTPAQVLLRWQVQKGITPLPRSSNPGRLRENLDIYDFQLTEQEMTLLDEIPAFAAEGENPDTFAFPYEVYA